MSGDLAIPPPWVGFERFRDIDAQAAQYRGYGQEYQQLSRGPFEGRVVSFDFGPDFTVHIETANQDLAQSVATPPRRWGLCVLAETSPPCALNGSMLARDHLVVCPEGKTLVGKTPAGINVYCMDLSRELLPEETGEWQTAGVIYDAVGARRLRETVESGLTTFMRLQSIDNYSAAAKAFKSSVADALWWVTARAARNSDQGPPRCARSRALRLFRVARERIDHGLKDGISIAAVCHEIGVSRRSLECIFRSIIGIGPGAYVRNLQLNRVRRDLLSSGNDRDSIGVIAARHGIWHWSRFSQNYKRLFGELPSETRARRRVDQGIIITRS